MNYNKKKINSKKKKKKDWKNSYKKGNSKIENKLNIEFKYYRSYDLE